MSSSDSHITFPCIEVSQPIGTFYIGVIEAPDLVAISYADVRRIADREVEVLLGIQRPLSSARVTELRQYVHTIDASFPTSIILAIEPDDAEYVASKGVMRVRRDERVAKIIDGQHRIAGLEDYSGPPFQMNVTIFVDMDVEDQALLFATINLKQTKVNKSLAYDLYEFAIGRSPQKTAHNIAKLLNSRDGSPLHQKIKILGRATGRRSETITQAAFVDRLMPHISSDPMKDRDTLKRSKQLERVDDTREQRLVFRNLFIEEKDAEIARIVWNYFTAVAHRWPGAWWNAIPGNILNRTTGFAALMRLLPVIYRAVARPGQVPPVPAFAGVFRRIQLEEDAFTSERYKPGTSGEAALVHELYEASGLIR